MHELRTERLLLRNWRPDDLEPFAAMNADPRVMEYFPATLSREESEAKLSRLQAFIVAHGFGMWAIEIPGVTCFAGSVGLNIPTIETHFTPCVEIGWRLAAEFWGKGYATEAAAAVLRFRIETLGFKEIVSYTATVNRRSRRVMEKLGMTHDPADDFDHPLVPEGHQLRRHVLYRIKDRANWPTRTY